MNTAAHDKEHACVLAIRGDLVGEECDHFRNLANERMEQRVRDFVVDLADTDFIDSQGYETLLWLLEACEEKLGQLKIAHCPPRVWKCMELCRLSPRFDLHDTVDDALASLH